MTKPQNQSRRRFIGAAASAAAGASAIGFPAITHCQSPNSKLQVGVIGVGGRGGSNFSKVQNETIVALCDVNKNNLDSAAAKKPEAKTFVDYRDLYAEMIEKLDAVVVSTPEHTHAFALLPALRAKKHVYCEKPLTRDVFESREVLKAWEAAGGLNGVATQMGTQIHAGENYRRVVELVQSGAIGDVTECHVWVSRAWGWQSPEDAKANKDIVSTQERPTEEHPVPAHLDWDKWIGPAPYRPFNNIYFPGPKWYRWWDFGNGTMSDLGSHRNDLPFWALNLDAPLTIEAGGPPAHDEIAPASMWAKYEYGPRGDMPPVSLTWHQGTEKPKIWHDNPAVKKFGDGALFIGSKGMLVAGYGNYALLPEGKEFDKPEPWIPKSLGHHEEWIHACKTGDPTTCHFGYAGPLTEANHLGNVAYRAGKKLEWDTKNLKIPNAPEAEKFISREYRDGWSLG
ncbi:MAG: putative dehydrogenase [Verrucomicrobiales bacterium]|jgi:predicted dehydrogenase